MKKDISIFRVFLSVGIFLSIFVIGYYILQFFLRADDAKESLLGWGFLSFIGITFYAFLIPVSLGFILSLVPKTSSEVSSTIVPSKGSLLRKIALISVGVVILIVIFLWAFTDSFIWSSSSSQTGVHQPAGSAPTSLQIDKSLQSPVIKRTLEK